MLTPAIGLATITFSSSDWANFLTHPLVSAVTPQFSYPPGTAPQPFAFQRLGKVQVGAGGSTLEGAFFAGTFRGRVFRFALLPSDELGQADSQSAEAQRQVADGVGGQVVGGRSRGGEGQVGDIGGRKSGEGQAFVRARDREDATKGAMKIQKALVRPLPLAAGDASDEEVSRWLKEAAFIAEGLGDWFSALEIDLDGWVLTCISTWGTGGRVHEREWVVRQQRGWVGGRFKFCVCRICARAGMTV
jgi:hypothetical protein